MALIVPNKTRFSLTWFEASTDPQPMIQPAKSRILYILGAGFSAPLGLPVMSNFLSRSKDLYFRDRERFAGFQKVYDTIAELSVIKNTFHADLHNIEEILSLLEMEAFMKGDPLKKEFVDFLSAVVKHLLPPLGENDGRPGCGNWHDVLFNQNPDWKPYLQMLGCLLNAELVNKGDSSARLLLSGSPSPARYAVVTLNYDTVIESAYLHLTSSFQTERIPKLSMGEYDPTWQSFQVAKLHGCADSGTLVPPTWRKGSADVVAAWKLAFNLIRDANHIRIVGYSLPLSDSYIRYLLKSAIRSSLDLKRIDILNQDRQGLEPRYREFIDFPNLRFRGERLQTLFNFLADALDGRSHHTRRGFTDPLRFDQLEPAHEKLFSS